MRALRWLWAAFLGALRRVGILGPDRHQLAFEAARAESLTRGSAQTVDGEMRSGVGVCIWCGAAAKRDMEEHCPDGHA